MLLFVDECDVVCAGMEPGLEGRLRANQALLSELRDRYHHRGAALTWDDGLPDWLTAQAGPHPSSRGWERLIDERRIGERLSPLLVAYLSGPEEAAPKRLRIQVDGGSLHGTASKSKKRKPQA